MSLETEKNISLENESEGLSHEISKDQILERFSDTYEEKKFPDVKLPDAIEHTEPRFVKTMISERINDIKQDLRNSAIAEPREVEKFLEKQALEIRDELFKPDSITKLPEEDYYKLYLIQMLEDEMNNPGNSQFDHIACINIDLNGLKHINDISGRTNGDKYLKIVSNWLRESDTLSLLKQSGANLSIARLKGDEFAVAIMDNPDSDIDWQKKWNTIQINLQQELEKLDVIDILPTNKLKQQIPEISNNFKFKVTAAIGTSTLENALQNPANKEKNIISKNDIAKNIVSKLMGTMLDTSYDNMKKNKLYTKKMLAIGNDNEQDLAKIYKL